MKNNGNYLKSIYKAKFPPVIIAPHQGRLQSTCKNSRQFCKIPGGVQPPRPRLSSVASPRAFRGKTSGTGISGTAGMLSMNSCGTTLSFSRTAWGGVVGPLILTKVSVLAARHPSNRCGCWDSVLDKFLDAAALRLWWRIWYDVFGDA